jgi:hypothetical protein
MAGSTGGRSDDERLAHRPEQLEERLEDGLEDLNDKPVEPKRPAAPKAPASSGRLPWF